VPSVVDDKCQVSDGHEVLRTNVNLKNMEIIVVLSSIAILNNEETACRSGKPMDNIRPPCPGGEEHA
jgi:hypothetical protein